MVGHPGVDTGALKELEDALNLLSTDDLVSELNNYKIMIGMQNPGENAKGIVGLGGLCIGKYLKDMSIVRTMVENEELLTAVDYYCPDFYDWLAPSMKIAYIIGDIIAKSINKPISS
jgi:proteasome assembly chaperone (PAC2) family protein